MNEALNARKSGKATGRVSLPRLTRALWLDFYLGHVSVGARLPSVRSIARKMGISPTTALEFYQELEAEGLVEARPRSGVFLRHVGTGAQRKPQDVALLKLLGDVAGRLPLLGASPARFTRLLMMRTGQVERSHFTFGFVAYRESFDLLYDQIRTRLGFNIPIVPLIARAADPAECAASLRESRTIRCLLTTYLHAKRTLELGRRFDRPVIVIQLQPAASAVLSPPAGKRYIITRDPELALELRRLICTVCLRETGDAPCGLTFTDIDVAPDEAMPCRCERVCTASLADTTKIAWIGRHALDVYATRTALAEVRRRFGTGTPVRPLPTDIADETLEQILFQYLFGVGPDADEELAGAGSARAMRHDAATRNGAA